MFFCELFKILHIVYPAIAKRPLVSLCVWGRLFSVTQALGTNLVSGIFLGGGGGLLQTCR